MSSNNATQQWPKPTPIPPGQCDSYGLVIHLSFHSPPIYGLVPGPYEFRGKGIFINFPFGSKVSRRQACEFIESQLSIHGMSWLSRSGNLWRLDLDGLRNFVGSLWKCASEWMTGIMLVEPEIETNWVKIFDRPREETSVQFLISREEIALSVNQRIFLGHRSIDKPLVRRVEEAMRLFGFQPWIDEKDLAAGAELERGLLEGMKNSCAAVFFVTHNYQDEGFSATEINYAIAEKRTKGSRFAIITLAVPSRDGTAPQIPDLLKPFVWKTTASELDMVLEVVKALPIVVGDVRWKNK